MSEIWLKFCNLIKSLTFFEDGGEDLQLLPDHKKVVSHHIKVVSHHIKLVSRHLQLLQLTTFNSSLQLI